MNFFGWGIRRVIPKFIPPEPVVEVGYIGVRFKVAMGEGDGYPAGEFGRDIPPVWLYPWLQEPGAPIKPLGDMLLYSGDSITLTYTRPEWREGNDDDESA